MSIKNLILRLVFLLLFIVGFGTAGYMFIEKWNFLDALFMSVETLTTVGYDFVHPLSEAGRIFTIIYILFGVILFLYLVAEFANTMTSFNLEKLISRQNMESDYGRTGVEIAVPYSIGDATEDETLVKANIAPANDCLVILGTIEQLTNFENFANT